MARSNPTSFLVEVLEGPSAGFVIELLGREMPYGPSGGGQVTFGRKQRSKLTWYPGNRFGSHQIIGPTITPTPINGIWKERYIGEDRPIDLVETFQELCDQGAQLRVSWQTLSYQGIIASIDFAPGNPTGGLGDIGWSMMFEWNADLTVNGPPRPRVGQLDFEIRNALVDAADGLATFGEVLTAFVEGASVFVGTTSSAFAATARVIGTFLDAISPAIQAESESAARSATEPQLPSSVVERSITATAQGQLTGGDAAEVISDIFPASVTVSDDLPSILNERIDRALIVTRAFGVLETQFELRRRLEAIVRPNDFAEVTPIVGSDLRELALRYYGNSDLWPRIAKQNGLTSSIVPSGLDKIVIPLSLPAATDDRVGC